MRSEEGVVVMDCSVHACADTGVMPARSVKIALICLCAVALIGVMLSAYGLFLDIEDIAQRIAAAQGAWLDLAVAGASCLLVAVMVAALAAFARKMVRGGELFSRAQVTRLLVIGVALLAEVLIGLVPSAPAPAALDGASIVEPALDLCLLSFSFVFFALSGVFEYGRMLKEEFDSFV